MNDKLPELARHIGSRIVQLRKHGGLNQQQLAARAQVSKSLLSTIENGQRVPSMTLLRRLVRALGLAAEQALIEVNDQKLHELWYEVYESESPLSLQLRAGQDLKLPVVEEVEVVPAGKTATYSASLQRQMAELCQSQHDLMRTVSELTAQSLRNFTGLAHHLDKMQERLDRLGEEVHIQTDKLNALQQQVSMPHPSAQPTPASQAQLAQLTERMDALGKELGEYRKNVRLAITQHQHEAQLMRIKLGELGESLRRR